MNTLFLVRGLPGSGKSHFAESYVARCVAADDYFVVDGEYRFNPDDLALAHKWCQRTTWDLLKSGEDVAVHNTFTQRWEMEPYITMAKEHNYRVVVVDCFDAGLTDEELAERNTHGVPVEVIAKMRERWEHDWRSRDPRAPWGR